MSTRVITPQLSLQQIAQGLIQHCRALRFSQARHELYASDAISVEADGSEVRGLEALDAKQAQWQAGFDQLHGVQISEPLITDHFISIAFTWDLTPKAGPRGGWSEIGLFQVKDGQVVREQFFYA